MTDVGRTRSLVAGLFLASGTAGLIYEVVWARQLALFLGITQYAHTAVITAYMIGLAAGSLYFGRLADRRQSMLLIYAALEFGVALYALATIGVFGLLQSTYATAAAALGMTGGGAHLLRFALALAVLLVPTFLMGGTLPVLVRGLARSLPQLGEETGHLYGINTLGAALGAFVAGFVLLPGLGVQGSILFGVGLNLAVAVVALRLARAPGASDAAARGPARRGPSRKKRRREATAEVLSATSARALLLGFALSGFGALVYQIAWIRSLTLVFGSSVYAFSTTLATFLAGLGFGSLIWARRLAGRRGWESTERQLRAAAVLELLLGLSALLGLPLIGQLPALLLAAVEAGIGESFAGHQLFIAGASFGVMILPTLLLGALFPLITGLWTRDAAALGRGVGTAYAVNTAGTIGGALLGGLVLLPVLGIQRSVIAASALHVCVAAGFWLLGRGRDARGLARALAAVAAMGLVFAATAWGLPPWDRALMTSGVFFNFDDLALRTGGKSLRDVSHEPALLYYAEGLDGTVSVVDEGSDRMLVINGKPDASSVGDLPTQVGLGQLPLLLHGGAKRVLIVGLGSGITASSVASHPKVERIDVLEISPEVVEASGYFADENRRVLEDPRVHLTVADARNFLLAAPDSWDVIVSEPSNPWISGISNLFTREFFELAQSKLAPRGLMTQWFHLYGVSAADLRTVLATFRAVFPAVTVWMPLGGDLVLIGSNEPHRLSYDALQDALAQPTIARDLSRARLAGIAPLARTFLIGGAALDGYVEGAALNTDDRPRIEFGAPRSLYTETALTNLLDLLDHLAGAEQVLPIEGGVRATAGGVLLPPLGLRISGAASDASGTRLEWLLARRAVANGGAHSLRMTSKRRFSWEDGAVEALTVGGRGIDRGQLHQNLGVGGRAVATGDIALMDGRPAAWWRGYDAASGHEQLRLAWACTPEGEILALYTATRRIDAAEQTAQALEDWARRFHCSG